MADREIFDTNARSHLIVQDSVSDTSENREPDDRDETHGGSDLTDLGFSRAAPSHAEASLRESYPNEARKRRASKRHRVGC